MYKNFNKEIPTTSAAITSSALLKYLVIISAISFIFKPNDGITNQTIRIQFGSGLTVALELLLAADILATAIAPTWDEIGKLAAIASLRTALNYFLERELKNNESKLSMQPNQRTKSE